jgi:hypothetical protein
MFRTCVIKNYKRVTKNRISDKSIEECSVQRPDERTLPYFEVVPEQVLADQRYLSLTSHQQGQFWRLLVHVLAPEKGMVVRHPSVIAKRIGMEMTSWEELERVLLRAGLLMEVEDGDYLLQHEFREQYLQTLESNNAKRRK